MFESIKEKTNSIKNCTDYSILLEVIEGPFILDTKQLIGIGIGIGQKVYLFCV